MKTTKNKQPIVTLLPILAIGALLLLAGCDQNRLDGCEGQIIVENEVPDLTLYVNGESYIRDLVHDEPPVFRHTRNEIITTTAKPLDGGIIASTINRFNEEKNSRTILEVVPKSIGEITVEIDATDDCLDRIVSTSFNVTVLDTTQNNN